MELIAVAMIAGVLGPGILAVVTYWLGRQTKQDDWARQDEVASRAEAASRALLDATNRAAEEQLEATKRVGEAATANLALTQVVHTLVNSNLTSSMQAELAALKSLALLDDAPERATAVAQAPARIAELEAQLAERATQAAKAERQLDAETERQKET